VKIGTRITAATSALVALTLGAYIIIDLRTAASQREARAIRQGRETARVLRASIETRGVAGVLKEADRISDELTRSTMHTVGSARQPLWNITILPKALVTDPGKKDESQIARLRRSLRQSQYSEREGRYVYFMLQLRVTRLGAPGDYEVVGVLEVRRDVSNINTGWADVLRALPLLGFIVLLTMLAVMAIVRSSVTRPIEKLLEGVDDVAQGDLSRVLLAERDDEIGTIATRFNEMTFSLRESRGEAARQSEAKLSLEQRLAQSEKLATLGQVAAEIAHEVGTPLNVIAGRAKGMGRKSKNPEAVEKNAKIIAEQTARITRIIQRLLDFTRRKVGASGPQPVNLNEVTLTTMDFLENQFAQSKVKTKLVRAEGIPAVLGDKDGLQQIMINLLLNAVQAMPEGGRLVVETSVKTRRRPGLEAAAEQPYVLLSITDTGVGIPAEVRDNIFEPFVTSKSRSGGTGLGLAVCSGIAKAHDGWIELDDADPPPGTVFRVYLPTVDRPPSMAAATSARA